MAEWTTNTLFERRRIRSLGEHIGIVVAFENQGIAAAEAVFNMRGNVADIGKQAEPARTVGKHKLAGLACVVRYCIRAHCNSVDGKVVVGRELPTLRETICFRRAKCGVGTGSEPDRNVVFASQWADAIDMVAVLMGHQDGRQRARLATAAREPALGFLQRETTVHQDCGLPAFDQQSVAAAAAAEQGEAQVAGSVRLCRVLCDDVTYQGAFDLLQLLLHVLEKTYAILGFCTLAFNIQDLQANSALFRLEHNLETLFDGFLALAKRQPAAEQAALF